MSGFLDGKPPTITAIVKLPVPKTFEEIDAADGFSGIKRVANNMGFDAEGGAWYLVILVQRTKDPTTGFMRVVAGFEKWVRAAAIPVRLGHGGHEEVSGFSSCDSGRECRSRTDERDELRRLVAHLVHAFECGDFGSRRHWIPFDCADCKRALEVAREVVPGPPYPVERGRGSPGGHKP